jgi:RNA polymerase sigma-70 factor (ECF subfamily)
MPGIDRKRFATLIEPHLESLYRAAYRLTRNRSDAEDLVQDTCIRACLNINELRSSKRVKSWLLRVLNNVFIDGARRKQASPVDVYANGTNLTAACASSELTPEESFSATQREAQLHRAWLSLDHGHRMLLALRAEGYSLPEISQITGIAMDALTMRLYRARQNLTIALTGEQTTKPQTRMEAIK